MAREDVVFVEAFGADLASWTSGLEVDDDDYAFTLRGFNGSIWTVIPEDQYVVHHRTGRVVKELFDGAGVKVDWSSYVNTAGVDDEGITAGSFDATYTLYNPSTQTWQPFTQQVQAMGYLGFGFDVVDPNTGVVDIPSSRNLHLRGATFSATIKSDNFVDGVSGWRIRRSGNIQVNDIIARGTIYASTGLIGGWTIAPTTISSGGITLNSATPAILLGSAATYGTGAGIFLGLDGGAYKFRAGDALSGTNPFFGYDGTDVTLRSAGIDVYDGGGIQTGNINKTGTGWFGTSPGSKTLRWDSTGADAGDVRMGSDGAFAKWDQSAATFYVQGNVEISGELRSAVFVKAITRVEAGTLIVALNGSILTAAVTTVAGTNSLVIKDSAGAAAAAVNDRLRMKRLSGDNWFTVTAVGALVGNGRTYTVTRQSGSNATFEEGTAVTNYGQSGQGVLYMTSDGINAPYYSVRTHAGSPWTTETEKARLGNLGGITDAVFGALSGYGLWTDNIYLTGSINATAGLIGGWTVNSTYLAKDTGTNATSAGLAPLDYPFFAGATYANRATAPFRVTPAGAMTATSGAIGGFTLSASTITADSGNFTLSSTTPKLTLGGASNYMTGTGFFVGQHSAIYKLHIGNPAGEYLSWDGTSLSVSGTIGSSGTDADIWTINQDLANVNVDLRWGRTTGGTAQMRWNGTVVALDKPLTVTGTINGIDLTVFGAASFLTLAPNAGMPNERTIVTGAGLVATDGGAGGNWTLNVGAGAGLTVNADDVALTLPGTLSVTSTNVATGNHTHDITASSNPGAAAALLMTDASGFLTLVKLTTPTLSAAANLTISPVGDIILDPTGDDVLPNLNYDINLGALSKKYLTLHAAELWVETLVAQNTIATIGGRILVGPTTTLVVDLAPATTTIHVKHNQMSSGDRVYLEANGSVEFMAITSAAGGSAGDYTYTVTRNLDGTGANQWYAGDAMFNLGTTGDGFIDLYSVRGVKSAAQVGPTIVGNVRNSNTYNDWSEHWAIGNLNGLYGYGSTTYGAAFGKYAAGVPNVTVDATNGIRMRLHTATLAQWDTSGDITLGATGAENVRITSTALEFRNVTTVLGSLDGTTWTLGAIGTENVKITPTSIRFYDGATNIYTELEGGVLTLGLVGGGEYTVIDGTNGIQMYGFGSLMVQLKNDGTLLLGDQGNENILLNSTTLQFRDVGVVYTSLTAGSLVLGRVANSVSRIVIGSGTVEGIARSAGGVDATYFELDAGGNLTLGNAALNQGNAFWNNTNKRLEFRGSTGGTVVQSYVDTTGAIVAGAGVVKLSSTGIYIIPTTSIAPARAYRFETSGGTELGGTYFFDDGTNTVLVLQTKPQTSHDNQVRIYSNAPAGFNALVELAAYDNTTLVAGVSCEAVTGTGDVWVTGDLESTDGEAYDIAAWRQIRFMNTRAAAVGVYDRLISVTGVNNTTAETTIFSKVVTAGDLLTTGGLRLTLKGTFTQNSGVSRTLTIRTKFGATTVATNILTIPDAAPAGTWHYEGILFNDDSASVQYFVGTSEAFRSAAILDQTRTVGGTAAINTGSNATILVSLQWSGLSADASRTFSLLEILSGQ